MENIKGFLQNAKVKNLIGWVMTFVVAIVLALFINTFIVRISEVHGPSMKQTLQHGETVFISRLPYLFGKVPSYGDIIVLDSEVNKNRNVLTDVKDSFKYNLISKLLLKQQTEKFWIKRVIGHPGDTIEFKVDGTVYRNGVKLEEGYVNPEETPKYINIKYTVKPGYLFVMGDNRNHSDDSRSTVLGQLPISHVIGKAIGK